MRFEDAIKAMREGKKCKIVGHPAYTYWLQGGTMCAEPRICQSDTGFCNPIGAFFFDVDWHIVEPPLPLPRRFRAKCDGHPVTGGKMSSGSLFWGGPNSLCDGYASSDQYAASTRKLTDIEYIDPPCTS